MDSEQSLSSDECMALLDELAIFAHYNDVVPLSDEEEIKLQRKMVGAQEASLKALAEEWYDLLAPYLGAQQEDSADAHIVFEQLREMIQIKLDDAKVGKAGA